MRTLGLHAAGDTLYLAVAVDGEVSDIGPYVFQQPQGLSAARGLTALRTEAAKVVTSLKIERVRILNAEPNYKGTYSSLLTRVALETIFALGAAEADVDCDRFTRAKVRSLLSLSKSGSLTARVGEVTAPVGPQWAPGKRDLAALTAIAADREG